MCMGIDSKCNFALPTVLLGLLCLWTWGIVKYSGLISFKIDGFHLIAVQGTLQSKCGYE